MDLRKSCAFLWWLSLAVVCCQHAAHARVAPMAHASAIKPKGSSKHAATWDIGDVLVASHNNVGFPRVDVLDPSDLSVKDTLDLVPACGVQSRTQGLSFSPRFSTMKLQLAVSCAPEQAADGKVVVVAAKDPQHPIVKTLPVQQAAASVYNRNGTLFVFALQQIAATEGASSVHAQSVNATPTGAHTAAEPVLQNRTAADGVGPSTAAESKAVSTPLHVNQTHLLPEGSKPGSLTDSGASAAIPAAPASPSAKQHIAAVNPAMVLLKLDSGAPPQQQSVTKAKKKQNEQKKAAATAAAAVTVPAVKLEVSAVLSSTNSSSVVAADLGANSTQLYYTVGQGVLKVLDTASAKQLPDRPLPAPNCTAVLARYDGSILVACSKCMYHLDADASAPPLREACFQLAAPFGRHMAVDPAGSHLLVSTSDGSLHSIRFTDFQLVKSTFLQGRSIGGVAVLGTVAANQQDCTPGTGCCPYGKVLPKGATCRKANNGCAEDAVCDGVSSLCSQNTVKANGTICRQPRKPCEQASRCDGVSDACPPFRSVKPKGARCSDNPGGNNVCAASGKCDGVSDECRINKAAKNGVSCPWRPDDDFNVFKQDAEVHTAALPPLSTSLPTAIGVLRNLVARGRRPLAVQSVNSAHNSLWGGAAQARPLSVCEGQCSSSKCVMTVAKRGCCVLPGSRLDDDVAAGSDKNTADRPGAKPRQRHRRRRGTEEDLYCWD